MAKELTERAIAEARPRGKKDFYLREGSRARGVGRLEVRICASGAKIAYFRYTVDGRRIRHRIGNVGPGEMTIDQIRDEARALAMKHRQPETRDVREAQRAEKARKDVEKVQVEQLAREQVARTEAAQRDTLQSLFDVYVAYLVSREKQSAGDAKSMFYRHVVEAHPDLAKKVASEVTPDDVTLILRRITSAGKGRTAGKLRSYLRAAYASAAGARLDAGAPADFLRFKIAANPVSVTGTLKKFNRTRDRALNVDELRAFWKALKSRADVKCAALRLDLLLGGQRPAQLVRVLTTDVDLHAGTIVLRDKKGARTQPRLHVLPLTGPARAVAEELLARSALLDSKWLFTSFGSAALRPETLTNTVAEIRDKLMQHDATIRRFDLRDIRRTIETQMAALGISKDVRAQIQSHGLGGVQDRHYDRHEYMAEKRSTLEVWAAHLAGTKHGKVVEFGARRRSRQTR